MTVARLYGYTLPKLPVVDDAKTEVNIDTKTEVDSDKPLPMTESDNNQISESYELPLLGIKVKSNIVGQVAEVTMDQRFSNNQDQVLNVQFVFPLQPQAAVIGCEALLDGVLVKGQIKQKDDALNMFNEAKAQGKVACLMSRQIDNNDNFALALGNLAPGKNIDVKIKYVVSLEYDHLKEVIQFCLPSNLNKVEVVNKDLDKCLFDQHYNDLPAQQPPLIYSSDFTGIELDITAKMNSAIKKVYCSYSSENMNWEVENNTISFKAVSPDVHWFNKDFVLQIGTRTQDVVYVEKSTNNTYAIMSIIQPHMSTAQNDDNEYIFMIDRSGSMKGTYIESARE
ncbi:hypothetical protein AKO1_007774, partial [Acrasis kona]